MEEWPLAYFVTFTTYGTWLHGRDEGSVDRDHNQHGRPLAPPQPPRQRSRRRSMVQCEYRLDRQRREVVLDTVVEVTTHRDWSLLAAHVRTNHVHAVVHARCLPERIIDDFKRYASRRLRERCGEAAGRRRWTEGRSRRYLWTEAMVADAVEYTLRGQGEPMSVFPAADQW